MTRSPIEIAAQAMHDFRRTGKPWAEVDVQRQDEYRIKASYVLESVRRAWL